MYQRRTVWASQSPLTASDLNAEFDAIAAAMQGLVAGLGGDPELTRGGIPIVINAADPTFNPTGTASFATRVAEAIAFAATVQRKVVWVPKFMWGYGADAEWSASIFQPSVLVVREGALYPAYDPIAYGAVVDDSGFNNTPVFNVCFSHASSADGPGAKVVALTIPGEYQLNTAVTRTAGVALWKLPGVSYTGSSIDANPRNVADIPPAIVHATAAFAGSRTASESAFSLFSLPGPIGGPSWKLASFMSRWRADAEPFTPWLWGPHHFPRLRVDGGDPVIITTTAVADRIHPMPFLRLEVMQIQPATAQLGVHITNTDSGDPHDFDIEVECIWVGV
jgi:hypothetical protein